MITPWSTLSVPSLLMPPPLEEAVLLLTWPLLMVRRRLVDLATLDTRVAVDLAVALQG